MLFSWAGATIIEATYGLEVQEDDDPLVSLINSAMESVEEAGIQGRFLIDTLPICQFQYSNPPDPP